MQAKIGTWPRHPVYKDAGRLNEEHFRSGMEGYALYMLTHIGMEPMSSEAVPMYLVGLGRELDERKWHKVYSKYESLGSEVA